MKSVFEFLMNRPNIDGFGYKQAPKSSYHKMQLELRVEPIEKWLGEYCAAALAGGATQEELTAAELFQLFNTWKRNNMPGYEVTSVQFGVRFSRLKLSGVTSNRNKQNSKTLIFKLIVDALA